MSIDLHEIESRALVKNQDDQETNRILTISPWVGVNLDTGIVVIYVVDLGAIAAEACSQLIDHLSQGGPVSSVDGVDVIYAIERVFRTVVE